MRKTTACSQIGLAFVGLGGLALLTALVNFLLTGVHSNWHALLFGILFSHVGIVADESEHFEKVKL
jgi:hypothetical protein